MGRTEYKPAELLPQVLPKPAEEFYTAIMTQDAWRDLARYTRERNRCFMATIDTIAGDAELHSVSMLLALLEQADGVPRFSPDTKYGFLADVNTDPAALRRRHKEQALGNPVLFEYMKRAASHARDPQKALTLGDIAYDMLYRQAQAAQLHKSLQM